MASVSDIATVRRNVNESTSETYTDEDIGVLIDTYGVAGASASIWREKAAGYAGLVDVTESGASHKYSDLYKNALAMAKRWEDLDVIAEIPVADGRVKVKKIVRS
jgi:hypothetical protein